MTDPITKTLHLGCTPAHAFDVFVNRIAAWWPLDGHAVSAAAGKAALDITIEPRVGGAIYETMYDGGRSDWGEVLAFEPGRHIAVTWHPGNNADNPTRVDVTFEARGAGCTVTLVHSGWEAWADSAEERRGGYDSGWDLVFIDRFGAAAQAEAA